MSTLQENTAGDFCRESRRIRPGVRFPGLRLPGGTRSFARDLTHNDGFIDCDPAALAVLEENLPEIIHDFQVDVIVTPQRVIWCGTPSDPQDLTGASCALSRSSNTSACQESEKVSHSRV
jgi:hypothetical protein